jgi:hypothetical protein
VKRYLATKFHAVDTRDLSDGIDKLLGKHPSNLALVVRILEWDAT